MVFQDLTYLQVDLLKRVLNTRIPCSFQKALSTVWFMLTWSHMLTETASQKTVNYFINNILKKTVFHRFEEKSTSILKKETRVSFKLIKQEYGSCLLIRLIFLFQNKRAHTFYLLPLAEIPQSHSSEKMEMEGLERR